MRNASDFLNKRNELNKENENHKKLVEGQWRLLTSIIEKAFENLTINTSYIDVSNCGTIYDENIRRLVADTDLGFLIANDKSGTKLFFDKSEYDRYTKKNAKSKMLECKKQDDRIDKADIKEMIETIEKAYSQKRRLHPDKITFGYLSNTLFSNMLRVNEMITRRHILEQHFSI